MKQPSENCRKFPDMTTGKQSVSESKQIADLKACLAECMDMLDNVQYWDTCPDRYIKRIEKLQEGYDTQHDSLVRQLGYRCAELNSQLHLPPAELQAYIDSEITRANNILTHG